MDKKKLNNYAVAFGISLVIFFIALWSYFPPRSWPTFLLIIPLAVMCLSIYIIAAERQKKFPMMQWKKVYRYYGITKNGNLLLSALMETRTTVSDNRGPDLVIGHQWEADSIYEAKVQDLKGIRKVTISDSLKHGETCVLDRNGGHLDGTPHLVFYSETETVKKEE